MGRVVAFSEFEDYLSEQRKIDFTPGTILDTNVLISLAYDVKEPHEEIKAFLDRYIAGEGIACFTTVNTRSEFLDFFRRLTMTEYLRDATDEYSKIKLTKHARSVTQSVSGRLSQRERRGGDPVFNDGDLKEIKRAFSADRHSGFEGWLDHCKAALSGKLREVDRLLSEELRVAYISPGEESQKKYFGKAMNWPDACEIAEATCLGLADSMILNALQCSCFSFMISLDIDIGYAVLASKELKDVVMPDKIVREYRHYHFSPQG